MESKINFYITIDLEIELFFISLFHKITMFSLFYRAKHTVCFPLLPHLLTLPQAYIMDVSGFSKYQEQQAGDTTLAVSHISIAFFHDLAALFDLFSYLLCVLLLQKQIQIKCSCCHQEGVTLIDIKYFYLISIKNLVFQNQWHQFW